VLVVNLRGDYDKLLGMVRHHAKAAEGVVLELLAYITLVCGSDERQWTIKQSRVGANSFSLHGRGRQYHFRAGHTGEGGVRVYDRARGKLIKTLRTRVEARDFVKSLVS